MGFKNVDFGEMNKEVDRSVPSLKKSDEMEDANQKLIEEYKKAKKQGNGGDEGPQTINRGAKKIQRPNNKGRDSK